MPDDSAYGWERAEAMAAEDAYSHDREDDLLPVTRRLTLSKEQVRARVRQRLKEAERD